MTDLSDLYQEVILDHYKSPRNFGVLEDATAAAQGDNPLCGDRLALFVKVKDGKVEAIRFKGLGCALSTASASLMTESVKGRSKEEIAATFAKVHEMVTTGKIPDGLEKLEVFSGVGEFPIRVKCVTLAWHTLRAALEGREETISTE